MDSDVIRYTIEKLKEWKHTAETVALKEIEGRSSCAMETREKVFCKIETMMPDLLTEMREDLTKYPLRREFVLLNKSWVYWARGNELVYYYDDHEELRNKIRILENLGFAQDISYNDVERFVITEELANYLLLPHSAPHLPAD